MKTLKLRAIKNVNIRTGKPERTSDNLKGIIYKGQEFEIEVEEIEGKEGKDKNSNKTWYKDRNGDYLWSGGFEVVDMEEKDTQFPWWIKEIGINQIWKKTKGKDVTVITLDTGYIQLPELPIDNIITRSIFTEENTNEENGIDNDGHGTLMASIIASNSEKFNGIAPKCNLISIKIFKNNSDSKNNWNNFMKGLDIIKGIVEEDKVYIVNCSCAGIADNETISKIQAKVDDLSNKFNIVFICAAGNDYTYINPNITPARKINNVISIAGINKQHERLISSNYWPEINLTCPGEFESSLIKAKFNNLDFAGSSHACAYATGLIALYLSIVQPNKPLYDLIRNFLTISSIEKRDTNNNIYKIINSEKLLNAFNNH